MEVIRDRVCPCRENSRPGIYDGLEDREVVIGGWHPAQLPRRTRDRTNVNTTPEVRADAIRRYHAGESFRQIAESLGVSDTSVRKWFHRSERQAAS
jgi:hypothetical protein